ncbi:hypothetical protein NDU88_007153 [Pleurodeles waltl]|uniref:Uncharacterized protein n=1 Tax=Pleurodeles waltl TaxID=8319 RepID=A0AAV7PQK3_PLEWA|nr:hypothetical protein NDU88_007153 [Pleurodeles waltl]
MRCRHRTRASSADRVRRVVVTGHTCPRSDLGRRLFNIESPRARQKGVQDYETTPTANETKRLQYHCLLLVRIVP